MNKSKVKPIPVKEEKKLRVMFNTNAPWSISGYGQQARQFMPLVRKEGYPTSCIAFYGLEGGAIALDDIMFFPKMGSAWGDDAMIHHGKTWKADVIITLQDIWTLDPNRLQELAKQGIRWIPIVPIDSEPVAPAIFERLKLAYRVISFSPFGHRELKRNGMNSTYIPHTIECDLFKKLDKQTIRKNAKLPQDKFMFGMVAANKDNPPRKNFDIVLDAFKLFHDKYADSCLYLHTIPGQQGGFPIMEYAKHLGLTDCIYHTDEYELLNNTSHEQMVNIYNSFDCFLLPSQNEGFGVPIIEASACELPVITTDFTAMRDLVINGETGFKVKVARTKFSPLLSNVAIPDTRDLFEKMEKIYLMSKEEREQMGKNGRKFVKENFDLPVVFEKHWKPFLETLEEEVYPN